MTRHWYQKNDERWQRYATVYRDLLDDVACALDKALRLDVGVQVTYLEGDLGTDLENSLTVRKGYPKIVEDAKMQPLHWPSVFPCFALKSRRVTGWYWAISPVPCESWPIILEVERTDVRPGSDARILYSWFTDWGGAYPWPNRETGRAAYYLLRLAEKYFSDTFCLAVGDLRGGNEEADDPFYVVGVWTQFVDHLYSNADRLICGLPAMHLQKEIATALAHPDVCGETIVAFMANHPAFDETVEDINEVYRVQAALSDRINGEWFAPTVIPSDQTLATLTPVHDQPPPWHWPKADV